MSFDEMKYEDFSWIRWDRMRWDFVNAIVKANQNHVGEDRLFCTGPDCCLDMARMLPVMGITSGISFDNEFGELITSAMRDGLFMVSTYVQFGLEHPLEGHMEVPFEVGRIIHSSYFTNANRDDSFAPHVSDKPSDEIRELLYAFVKLAFPDDFMAAVHQKNSGESFEQPFALEETWFGEGLAWKRLIIREFFGGIQGLLKDSDLSSVTDQQIDLSHVRTLNQAISEIRGIDFAMFNKVNPRIGGG